MEAIRDQSLQHRIPFSSSEAAFRPFRSCVNIPAVRPKPFRPTRNLKRLHIVSLHQDHSERSSEQLNFSTGAFLIAKLLYLSGALGFTDATSNSDLAVCTYPGS